MTLRQPSDTDPYGEFNPYWPEPFEDLYREAGAARMMRELGISAEETTELLADAHRAAKPVYNPEGKEDES